MKEYYFGEYVHYYVHDAVDFNGMESAKDFLCEWEKYLLRKLSAGYQIVSSEFIDRPPESKANPIGTLGIKIRVRVNSDVDLDPYLMKHDLSRLI